MTARAAAIALRLLVFAALLFAADRAIAGFIQCSALGCLPNGGASW
jgi:hypothetical protein